MKGWCGKGDRLSTDGEHAEGMGTRKLVIEDVKAAKNVKLQGSVQV